MSLSKNDDLITSGPFSGAGKLSLNYYNIILQSNRLKRKVHKTERKYFIIPNYGLPVYEEENTVVHSTNFKIKKFLEEENSLIENSSNSTLQENENEEKKLFQGENYKYYNLHQDKIKFDKKYGIKKNKNESTYTPGFYRTNTNYYHKIKLGLEWKNLTGRNEKRIIEDNKDNKDNKVNINIPKKIYKKKVNNSNCFIDMAKQTERNGFPSHNDLRQRCEKKYIPINSKLEKENWKKFCKKPLVAVSPFSNNSYEIFGYRRDFSPLTNKIKKIILKSKNITSSPGASPTNTNRNNRKNKFPYLTKYNSALDFKKSKIKKKFFKNPIKDENKPICILYPNYKSIEERVKMMVVYNNQKPVNKKNKINEFKGINLNDLYDASQSYEKIYGNKLSSVPNFEKMISRPTDSILPSFMKGIYNGMSSYINTDKNLILNSDKKYNEHYIKIKNRKQLIHKFLKSKSDKKLKSDSSKQMLKKFNDLYTNFYQTLKKNRKIKANNE